MPFPGHRFRLRSQGSPAIAVALALSALTAHASPSAELDDQTRAGARDLAVQGRAAYAAGDYEKARDLFHRAYALVSAPTVSLHEARALAKLGRLVESAEAYMRTVQTPVDERAPEQFHKAVEDAEAERTALKARIPTLFFGVGGLSSTDPAPVVTLDGKPLSAEFLGVERPIDPGPHRVVVHVGDHPEASATFTLAEGEHRRVELAVEPSTSSVSPGESAPPPATRTDHEGGRNHYGGRTLAFVALGVGAAGAAVGVGAGVWATARHADAEKECPENRCTPSGSGAVDSFRTLRTVSTAGYVVGAVGAAAGITLLLTAPRDDVHAGTRSVGLWVGLGRAGVAGEFE